MDVNDAASTQRIRKVFAELRIEEKEQCGPSKDDEELDPNQRRPIPRTTGSTSNPMKTLVASALEQGKAKSYDREEREQRSGSKKCRGEKHANKRNQTAPVA
jgi:hypothetical protein